MPERLGKTEGLSITDASQQDRECIYRLRHEVYAAELHQHSLNTAQQLTDDLDSFNVYITAKLNGQVVGFISITPPDGQRYSIDKYFTRDSMPFDFNQGLYEVRLLTVMSPSRGSLMASLLMYAAFRWIEEKGGTRIVAIGRQEILDLYLKVGLKPLGRKAQSGAVTYELLSETTGNMRKHISKYGMELKKLKKKIAWQLEIPFEHQDVCFHGGAFFKAIGEEFDDLNKRHLIINADVLDAWFPPSPKVIHALRENLPWTLSTSPPTNCEGMTRTIARIRNLDLACVLPGAGSSDLIYLCLRHWLTSHSRVLILDPTYGEYTHVMENVLGCQMDHFILSRDEGYTVNSTRLKDKLNAYFYDMVIIVNPNSPTGKYLPKEELEHVIKNIPTNTMVWIDETYLEYVGSEHSLEYLSTQSENVVVCKSMSKVYALSGLRAAYLCASAEMINEVRRITPPWAVSLPAQIAAVMALQDSDYYAARYAETHVLRNELIAQLNGIDSLEIVPGVANFLLCHLAENGPDAAAVVSQCRMDGLYLRDVSAMGTAIGKHAFRVAVKDKDTNQRMAGILRKVLQDAPTVRESAAGK